jgi:hypothetical protein
MRNGTRGETRPASTEEGRAGKHLRRLDVHGEVLAVVANDVACERGRRESATVKKGDEGRGGVPAGL